MRASVGGGQELIILLFAGQDVLQNEYLLINRLHGALVFLVQA